MICKFLLTHCWWFVSLGACLEKRDIGKGSWLQICSVFPKKRLDLQFDSFDVHNVPQPFSLLLSLSLSISLVLSGAIKSVYKPPDISMLLCFPQMWNGISKLPFLEWNHRNHLGFYWFKNFLFCHFWFVLSFCRTHSPLMCSTNLPVFCLGWQAGIPSEQSNNGFQFVSLGNAVDRIVSHAIHNHFHNLDTLSHCHR